MYKNNVRIVEISGHRITRRRSEKHNETYNYNCNFLVNYVELFNEFESEKCKI